MQFRLSGALVGLFVGAVASSLLGLVLFVAYFTFAQLVLAHLGPAVALHGWLSEAGTAPWLCVVLAPCLLCSALGFAKGRAIFTPRDF
jgi:hypothetical protein